MSFTPNPHRKPFRNAISTINNNVIRESASLSRSDLSLSEKTCSCSVPSLTASCEGTFRSSEDVEESSTSPGDLGSDSGSLVVEMHSVGEDIEDCSSSQSQDSYQTSDDDDDDDNEYQEARKGTGPLTILQDNDSPDSSSEEDASFANDPTTSDTGNLTSESGSQDRESFEQVPLTPQDNVIPWEKTKNDASNIHLKGREDKTVISNANSFDQATSPIKQVSLAAANSGPQNTLHKQNWQLVLDSYRANARNKNENTTKSPLPAAPIESSTSFPRPRRVRNTESSSDKSLILSPPSTISLEGSDITDARSATLASRMASAGDSTEEDDAADSSSYTAVDDAGQRTTPSIGEPTCSSFSRTMVRRGSSKAPSDPQDLCSDPSAFDTFLATSIAQAQALQAQGQEALSREIQKILASVLTEANCAKGKGQAKSVCWRDRYG